MRAVINKMSLKFDSRSVNEAFARQAVGAFAAQLVHGTRANVEAIDAQIAANSREWKVERMAAVDRNLTRMATYEMCFAEEKLTPNIAINEAVELAKKYGTDDSSRYVNGILGAIMKSAKSAE